MAQPQISLTTNGIDGIELIDSGYLPVSVVMALRTNHINRILPYVAVVRNIGVLPITGLDIRYEITTQGNEVVKNFFYGSPGEIANSTSFPILAPGKSAVLSPDHSVNEQILGSGTIPSLSVEQRNGIHRKVDFFDHADWVVISIDSVIRSDGAIVGPDRSGTFHKFQQQIWGYTEFRNEMLRRVSEGESDAAIVLWLTQTANLKPIRLGKNEPLDQGVMTQKALARHYLTLIQNGQRQHCVSRLTKATPERALHRIFRVHQGGPH